MNSAPEFYHHTISKLFEGIDDASSATDDFLIASVDNDSNMRAVEEVLKQLEKHGLTVNEKKIEIGLSEITFWHEIHSTRSFFE